MCHIHTSTELSEHICLVHPAYRAYVQEQLEKGEAFCFDDSKPRFTAAYIKVCPKEFALLKRLLDKDIVDKRRDCREHFNGISTCNNWLQYTNYKHASITDYLVRHGAKRIGLSHTSRYPKLSDIFGDVYPQMYEAMIDIQKTLRWHHDWINNVYNKEIRDTVRIYFCDDISNLIFSFMFNIHNNKKYKGDNIYYTRYRSPIDRSHICSTY